MKNINANKGIATLSLGLLIICSSFLAKPAYKLFDKNGNETNYAAMLKQAGESDVILFGELHNNPICHWLQLELLKDIYGLKADNMLLGAEMFESDDQLLFDEYLSGQISEKNFEREAKLWNNYRTDYKPLINFAKDINLRFVATNVPRRYANMVYHGGFEALSELSEVAKTYMPPIPFAYDSTLLGYKNMIDVAGGHGGDNLPKSQALKDATMAHFILQNLQRNQTFVHFNGTYHSNNFEGIGWYLKFANPSLKVMTIASVQQLEIDLLREEEKGIADFILVIPETMTKTY